MENFIWVGCRSLIYLQVFFFLLCSCTFFPLFRWCSNRTGCACRHVYHTNQQLVQSSQTVHHQPHPFVQDCNQCPGQPCTHCHLRNVVHHISNIMATDLRWHSERSECNSKPSIGSAWTVQPDLSTQSLAKYLYNTKRRMATAAFRDHWKCCNNQCPHGGIGIIPSDSWSWTLCCGHRWK